MDEEICMITIDQETGKNMIIWEKTKDVDTESYILWRKTTVKGVFDMIYESNFDNESIFVDLDSNPEVKSEVYYLTLIDNCGVSSEPSPTHKPMFLTSSLGANEDEINLAWTPYLIDNEEINFPSYIIYRGAGTADLVPIDTIAAGTGTNLYVDANPPTDVDIFYRIAGVKEVPCDPNNIGGKKAQSGPFVHSFSNLEDNRIKTSVLERYANKLKPYPNPMESSSFINLTANQTFPLQLKILDTNGRIVRIKDYNENHIVIEKGNLKAGFYFIEILSDKKYIAKLMVK